MQKRAKTALENIPDNIRAARVYRNYTQEYVASRIGLSQNGYSKIELGYTKITLEKLLCIADALEIDATDLIEFDTVKFSRA